MSRAGVKTPPKTRTGIQVARPEQGVPARARRAATAQVLDLHRSYGNSFVSQLLGGAPIQRACGCGSGCCSSPADKVGDVVQRAPLAGSPLPSSTRAAMESSFGTNFGGVRVHTGPQATGLAGGLGARAFTTGQNIYFGEGQYNPGTSAGQGLLAHELAHVVQQRSGRAPTAGIDTPGDPYEREAEAAAAAVLAGERPRVSLLDGTGAIRRQPERIKHELISPMPLEVPGLQLTPDDRDVIVSRYENAAGARRLRTTDAGR